ncbi:hypothetical protein, partial [Pseudomonas syringae]|uniref:hypothetical protein n=1 Tax=Pseudomonas syringae TaxID=317 RepID=UPI001F21AB3A
TKHCRRPSSVISGCRTIAPIAVVRFDRRGQADPVCSTATLIKMPSHAGCEGIPAAKFMGFTILFPSL